jgi:transposase
MAKRSRAAWTKLVREWRESGLTAKAFATRRDVRETTLLWWSSRLNREVDELRVRPLEFIEVAAPTSSTVADARFEIHLANGRTITVPLAFDPEALRRLLTIVEVER